MTNKVDVLLVLPNIYISNRIPDYDPKEPLGLLSLLAVLRQEGYSCALLNADFLGLSVESTLDAIMSFAPRVVGFSICERAIDVCKVLIPVLRHRGFSGQIIAGGFYATLAPETLLTRIPEIEGLILGEGEKTLLEVLSGGFVGTLGVVYQNNGAIIREPCRPAIRDLDTLPFPARDWLKASVNRVGYGSVHSSRGCQGNCTFCSQRSFDRANPGARWRGRSAENVVDELEYLDRTYGVGVIKFGDDNIFGPKQVGQIRIVDICEGILRRGLKLRLMGYCRVDNVNRDVVQLMKRAGFERVLVGIETMHHHTLKKFRKGISPQKSRNALEILSDEGLSVAHAFILFNPYSTIKSIEQDLAFLDSEHGYASSIAKSLKVHAGTDIQHVLETDGLLLPVEEGSGQYHNYRVPNDVARLYGMLKSVWRAWIDSFSFEMRPYTIQLKKSPNFNARSGWDSYLEYMWQVQYYLVRSIIQWIKEDTFDQQTCITALHEACGRLQCLADAILSQMKAIKEEQGEEISDLDYSIPYPQLQIFWRKNAPIHGHEMPDLFTVDESIIAREMSAIFNDRSLVILPEHYRWNDD